MNGYCRRLLVPLAAAVFGFQAFLIAASPVEQAAAPVTFAKLPIKELTVFKDGHALVAHEGELPVDANGNENMDYLPAPGIGTFWPYSADKAARLSIFFSVRQRALVDTISLSMPEFFEGIIGADAIGKE